MSEELLTRVTGDELHKCKAYPADQKCTIWSFKNVQDLKLYGYLWEAKNPRSMLFYIHGVASHGRLSMMRPCITDGVYNVYYEGSHAERLNNAGISLFCLDLQGCGCSEAWEEVRSNCRAFKDYSNDVLQFIYLALKTLDKEHGRIDIPAFLGGMSMGGAITLQSMQILEDDTLNYRKYLISRIRGFVLLSAMLDLSSQKRKFVLRMLSYVTPFVSYMLPHAAILRLQMDRPELDEIRKADPLSYREKIPFRLGYELSWNCDYIRDHSENVGDTKKSLEGTGTKGGLACLCIHSKTDTVCDYDGSVKAVSLMKHVNDKTMTLKENAHHDVLAEPDGIENMDIIIKWIQDRS